MDMRDLNSFFGEGTVLKGALKFKGLLRFDGEFEGEVQSDDTFIVGASGKVRANVNTGNLYNFGEITGDIKASGKISLHSKSKLTGNINTPVLITEELAYFQGSCVMPVRPRTETIPETAVTDPMLPPDLPSVDEHGVISQPGGRYGAAGKAAAVGVGGGALVVALIALVMFGGYDLESLNQINTPAVSVETAENVSANQIEKLRQEGLDAFSNKDYELAMSSFSVIVETQDNDQRALEMLGASAEKAGNKELAIDSYQTLVSINPSLKILESLAGLYDEADRKEALISTLKEMEKLSPNDAAISKRLARLTALRKTKKSIYKQLEEEIQKSPKKPEPRLKLARQYIKERNYVKALEVLQKGVKNLPSHHDLRLTLAQTLHRTGKEKDALEHYLVLAKNNPGIIEAENNIAFAQLNKGLLNDAAEKFQASLKRDPDNFRGRLGLAMVLSKLGQNDKAAKECEKILTRADDYAPAMNRLAWIYAKQGIHLDKAESLSTKSLSIFRDIPEYIDTLSEINFKKGKYDEAIRLIKKAVKMIPDDPYYKRQLFKFRRAKRKSG